MTEAARPPSAKATVLSLRELAPGGYMELDLMAPRVAARARPGQFVIVQAHPNSARISLPIVELGPEEGRLVLVFQAEGRASLAALRAGELVQAVMGPVGRPTRLEQLGTVVLAGLGVEAFSLAAIGRGFRQEGNHVVCLAAGEEPLLQPLTDKLSEACTRVDTAPDGLTLLALLGETLRESGAALTLAAGPVPFLKAVRELTLARGVPTRLRFNPVMLDGAGLCGGCRVKVAGQHKLCCLEGAEFEAADLDLDYLEQRQRACHLV